MLIMRRLSVLVVALAACVIAACADAGPFFDSSSPKIARPGDVVTLRAGMGMKVNDRMPLYLVPSRQAPRPYLCHHGSAYCTPTARAAPTEQPYQRIATLDVRHVSGTPASGYTVTIRYRIPRHTTPGHYAYVLYCRWCARHGTGSLVAWPTQRITGKPRTIPIGTALVVR
jgi:hypothetical protein